jgi:LuxR family transcriptional regulator, maltose regulon positive regulatory protein
MNMNTPIPLENQLLATKFYVPVTLGPLISRPRLMTVLDESLKHPLTLVSAAAGFGKTTLLSMWSQSLPASTPRVAWVSLDEEDNEPRLFWASLLTALYKQAPACFTSLLTLLQSPQSPPLTFLLAELINLLAEGTDHFLLILDDYHLITEQQVHTALAYLIEHLPLQLRIMVATRIDPLLPLARLRSREQALEVRTDQLRCTPEETKAFLQEVMGLSLPDETIQQITTRTEGWLVGLHLLGLSLPGHADPLRLLQEISGDQRYILDYLTEEVLQRQPQEIQTFLLSTCILERLNAPLCDAVMDQANSQQILQQLEKANLFVVSLDSKRQWYRYHALFAEALRYRLEQMHPDLVPILHHRASLWYTQHHQNTQAILHAFNAKEWHRAADLIERQSLQLVVLTWGVSEHQLTNLQRWLEQLPADIMRSRPRLCFACAHLLWTVTPLSVLNAWLQAAQTRLTTLLSREATENIPSPIPSPEIRQEQENLLAWVLVSRALLESFQGNREAVDSFCQQALSLLSEQNYPLRVQLAMAQFRTSYCSSANDAVAAVENGLQTIFLAQASGNTRLTFAVIGGMTLYMIGTGQLHEVQRLAQQARLLGKHEEGFLSPDVGWPAIFHAEVLREWNQLDEALSLAREAISLCQQVESNSSPFYLAYGYPILLRIFLSHGELHEAYSAFQQIEHIGTIMNQYSYLYARSYFTTIDQVRLWLACGELDRATRWAQELDLGERRGTPFAREREEVARVRVLLAKNQPDLALQRLEPVLQRATAGKRWGHVIEIRLLQALAHQMCQEETKALDVLSKAVRLAEPEGYIRSFVEEGTPIEVLLYRLRKRSRKQGPTLYLDTLLAAFQQESKVHAPTGEHTKAQPLPEPLSEREGEVLQLLAHGASNLEIAQELVITIDTVKRHVSHIFSKLGVQNRVQAVRQARELDLLNEKL